MPGFMHGLAQDPLLPAPGMFWGKYFMFYRFTVHFTDKETEAQGGETT